MGWPSKLVSEVVLVRRLVLYTLYKSVIGCRLPREGGVTLGTTLDKVALFGWGNPWKGLIAKCSLLKVLQQSGSHILHFWCGSLATPPNIHHTPQSTHRLLVLHHGICILKTLGSPRAPSFRSQISLVWGGRIPTVMGQLIPRVDGTSYRRSSRKPKEVQRGRWGQLPLSLSLLKTDSSWGGSRMENVPLWGSQSDSANLTILPKANPTSHVPSSFCLNF